MIAAVSTNLELDGVGLVLEGCRDLARELERIELCSFDQKLVRLELACEQDRLDDALQRFELLDEHVHQRLALFAREVEVGACERDRGPVHAAKRGPKFVG